MDTVKKVATAISAAEDAWKLKDGPVHEHMARAAIEAYQDAIWPVAHFSNLTMLPEIRQVKANQLTAHVLHVIGPFLCDHGDSRSHESASRALQQIFYESGADIITDMDRRVAGLPARGPSGLTVQELGILENRKLEAMMQPIRMIVDR